MELKLLYRIHVRGRVQGVGFRWNAARKARECGLNGFVKNLSDGSVYIEAEGTRPMLDNYVEWCRTGPPFSSVDSVKVTSFPPAGYTDFIISR